MKKLVAVLGLILASATCGLAQQTYPIVTNFESYNIFASSTSCLVSQSCVWMKLQAGTTTVAVTLSGTFTGTFIVEQSSDGGVTFATVATYTTPQTAVVFTVTGMTDFRIRCSVFSAGPALATLSSGGNQININSGGANITGQANTYGAFLQDFSAATIKLPQSALFVPTASSNIGIDTTNVALHVWTNQDMRMTMFLNNTVPTTNVFPKTTLPGSGVLGPSLLSDSGTVLSYTGTGGLNSPAYSSATNCSSSASPAVCGSSAAGSFVLPAAATSVTVNTTAVTANSQIMVVNDDSLGTKLSVTCNTALDQVFVSGRVAATSFTITGTAPVTNPNCYSYLVMN